MTTESGIGAMASSPLRSPRIVTLVVSLVLLNMALHGCEDAEPGSRTLSGLPQMTAVEELRIGSLDDPETALTFVGSMHVSDDGMMHVTQPLVAEIRVYSADGELLRTVGRRGEGPGEFQRIGMLGVVGDSLWVFDSGTDRFSFFDPGSGALLGSVRAPSTDPGRAGVPATAYSLLDDSTFLTFPVVPSDQITAGEITEVPVHLIDRDGTRIATLAPRHFVNLNWEVVVRRGGEVRGISSGAQPFSDARLWNVVPDQPAVVTLDRPAPAGTDQAVLHFRKVSFQGDTLVSRELSFDPVPITDGMVDSVLRVQIPDEGLFGVPASAARETARESLYRPAHLPGVADMILGDDGRIWLRSNDVDDRGVAWWILSSDGVPQATVRLPTRLRAMAARGDRLWGTVVADFGVPYVVRYRMEAAGG